MSLTMNQVKRAAAKVQLVITENKTVRELYDYYSPVLDEKATLRRVSLFAYGSGRVVLNPEERFEAVQIINDRADELLDN